MRLAAISIDLDGLRHYEALHGIPSQSRATAVADLAPTRLADLLSAIDRGGRPGTFFAIGSEIPEGGGSLRTLALAGHEIGNHTLDHPYRLTRLPADELARQVEGGAAAIEAKTGVRPAGFRAPGYTLSSPLLDAVIASGHRYDSSVFPAVPYYVAKWAVMRYLRARGRASAALLDRPRVLTAPRLPYRPAVQEPYARGALPLVELPVTVEPLSRVPFIGTFVVSAPMPLVRAAYLSLRREPFLNLELHGIDLLDSTDGVSPTLAAAQPDLRISARLKTRRLATVFSWLAQDYEVVTLATAAARLGPKLDAEASGRPAV